MHYILCLQHKHYIFTPHPSMSYGVYATGQGKMMLRVGIVLMEACSEKIIGIIQSRIAPVQFRWIKLTDNNSHHCSACKNAQAVLRTASPPIYSPPQPIEAHVGLMPSHCGSVCPKVSTPLPAETPPNAKEVVNITVEDLDLETNLDSH
jgi:hypothetical protein